MTAPAKDMGGIIFLQRTNGGGNTAPEKNHVFDPVAICLIKSSCPAPYGWQRVL
jgi:hypothetical protein